MIPLDFDRLAAATSLGPRSISLARRILVDGLTVADAAREANCTRQQASRAAQRIRRALLAETVCPGCGRPL